MLRWSVALAILAAIVIFWFGRWQAGIAFVIGAALGVLNLHWVWETGRVLMEAQTARVPRKTVVLIAARYPLVLGGLVLLYFKGWLPLLPVIAGLLVPAGGVLVESLVLIGAALNDKQAV